MQSMNKPMMSAEEYRNILSRLGLKHQDLAEALGVTTRTSFNYARDGAPRYISLALDTILRAAGKARPRKRSTLRH